MKMNPFFIKRKNKSHEFIAVYSMVVYVVAHSSWFQCALSPSVINVLQLLHNLNA